MLNIDNQTKIPIQLIKYKITGFLCFKFYVKMKTYELKSSSICLEMKREYQNTHL